MCHVIFSLFISIYVFTYPESNSKCATMTMIVTLSPICRGKEKIFVHGISEIYVHVWKEGKQDDFISLHLHLHLSLYSLIHSSVFFSLKGRFEWRESRVEQGRKNFVLN